MNITTIDKRHPITIAICELTKSCKNDELLSKLKAELIDLVIEIAQKFTGFSTVESIKKSLEIALGIISLGLIHQQKISGDDDSTKPIINLGFKELTKTAIMLIKEISQYPENPDNLFEQPKKFQAKDYIVRFSMARNRTNETWEGYDLLQREINSRKSAKSIVELSKWMIQTLSGNMYEWKLQNVSTHSDNEVYPIPDQIINTFLFRFCNELPTVGKLELTKSHFRKARNKYESNPEKWKVEKRAKFDSLVSNIPEDLKAALVIQNKDWFERHLSNGPVIIPKGNESLDDLEILWPYIVRMI
jgi:hypothetical protein